MSDKKLDSKDKRYTDLENKLKRALADYQNLKKRTEREQRETIEFANQVLLLKVLTILEGFEMVHHQFKSLLSHEGFKPVKIKPGDKFDPALMEAIDGKGEKVEQVLSVPYKLHDKIVRPGRVKVGK